MKTGRPLEHDYTAMCETTVNGWELISLTRARGGESKQMVFKARCRECRKICYPRAYSVAVGQSKCCRDCAANSAKAARLNRRLAAARAFIAKYESTQPKIVGVPTLVPPPPKPVNLRIHKTHAFKKPRGSGFSAGVQVCAKCSMQSDWAGAENPCGQPVVVVKRATPSGEYAAA